MRRSVRWGEATREASGYKSVQTKERLQATRAYKQKRGFRLQERTNKREASGYKSVQTKDRLQRSGGYTSVPQKRGYN
jgi:hypothetical protein